MTKYVFCIDDGEHTEQIEEFTSLEEARKFYKKEEKKVDEDPEKYFGQSKEDWSEDYYPDISLNEYGGENDEEFIDWIEVCSPDREKEEEED